MGDEEEESPAGLLVLSTYSLSHLWSACVLGSHHAMGCYPQLTGGDHVSVTER